jgi:hypothetical protein
MATLNEPRPASPVRLATAPRWVAPVFAVLGAATLPWTVYLAMTLPKQANTHHYRLAWVGFDAMLIVVLLATAYVAWRGNRLVGLLATITATMLVVDAWFDVTTSNQADRPGAILSAVFIEVPLAAVCGWITMHVDQVIERRLRYLTRRAARLSATAETEATVLARIRAARAGAATAVLGGKVAEAGRRAAEHTVSEAETGDPGA